MGAGADKASDGAAPTATAGLYVTQAGLVHNLWTVYVVATFAAAGFGAAEARVEAAALAVTVGFWLFTLGHLALLHQALALLEALRLDAAAESKPAPPNRIVPAIAAIHNPWRLALAIHLAIDLCVTAALWAPLV